jgi:uncharacterized protein YbaR (Trm112 family)
VLRPLRGSDEEWLAESGTVPAAFAVSRLLGDCIVRAEGGNEPGLALARSLLVGDRDFLMLQLRKMTLGSRVLAVIACPACPSRMDVELDVAQIEIDRPDSVAAAYSLESGSRTIRFRLPTGADQEAVARLPLEQAVDALLLRCTVDDGGCAIDADERDALISAMEAAAPRVEPELDLTCPDCGHAFVLPIEIGSFFLDEMRVRSELLLREIHTLAFHYHWTEGEILRLSRERRRAYLSLLSDAVRSD